MTQYVVKADVPHTLHIPRSDKIDRLTYCGRELIGQIIKTQFVGKKDKVCHPCLMSIK